jgi:predicted deacylase
MIEENLEIDGFIIKPGEQKIIELKVAKLPSGTQIHLPVYVFRGKEPGPSVLFCGGLHGDEINGIEIVRRLVQGDHLQTLMKGTVIALPIINIYGFLSFSRDVPDGKDVNRSFPGNIDGSLASHVAHILSTRILPFIDFGIDFHTGGASRTNYPQVRFAAEDPNSLELAQIFGAPFLLNTNYIESSLRWQANKMGKAIIVYEGGESMRLDELPITEGINGVVRLLNHYGMIGHKPASHKSVMMMKSSWIRAPRAGIFRSLKKSGNKVKSGALIGIINDPSENNEELVYSKEAGYIIGHNNIPVVNRGDALFHIGLE